MQETKLPNIGILGGGQLATMMTEAYHDLGGTVAIFCDGPDSPAITVADKYTVGDANKIEQLVPFFESVDLVTLENEFIDSQLLIDAVNKTGTQVYPDPQRYKKIEDKLSENLFFRNLGVPIGDFFVVSDAADLIDKPGYLKLIKGGYDGIGTYKVADKKEATDTFERISSAGTIIFEHEISFTKELSLIAVAGSDEMAFYPLVETHQENATCRYVSFPAGVDDAVEIEAKEIVGKIMKALDTKGLFAFELFLTDDGGLYINESAPRPHNSGHITLDSMNCSQFENHMRAVAGLPLISPKAIKDHAIMLNLLGTRDGDFAPEKVLSTIEDQDLAVKFYAKKQSRVKRKMGHINLWGNDTWQRARKLVADLEI